VPAFELTGPLETERLLLRRYTVDDFDALYAMRSNAEVARYLYWGPQTEEEVRETLARKIASVSIRSEGDVLALAAEERGTGEVVADVILHWVSAEHGLAEIGYIVHPDHLGRGYATEASRPLLAVAFDALGLHRVIGRLEARNRGSVRVLEKLGMRREAHFVENSSSRTNGRASSSTPSSPASGARIGLPRHRLRIAEAGSGTRGRGEGHGRA
jgi:RimJ/RimL family protein N-acetyltransferase